jgi:hypothetical protein
MNSFVSSKCAGRLFMALAAISGIFLAAGCGNGSSFTPPNNQGFSNSSLSGTYVFSSQGVDANDYPVSIAGALVANGTGGITAGTIDVVDAVFDISPATPPSPVAQTISGGTYSIGSDGRGLVNLVSSNSTYGTYTLDIVLSSPSQGLVTEFDGKGTGSGTIDLQTALTGLSQLAGPYALTLAGDDSSLDPVGTVGSFTLDTNGNITAGVQDFNDNGFPYLDLAINPVTAAVLGTGTGPGTITLNTSQFGSLTFDFYPVDATHLKFIETDYAEFLAGDVFTQTGASIPTGAMVFTMAGGDTAQAVPIVVGGLLTSTGGGNFTGLEDLNNGGTISPSQLQFAGTPGASGTIGGRVIVNLNGFDPATQWAIYPFSGPSGSSGGLLMLETDFSNLTQGVAFPQSATSFAAAGYGLNLSGENTSGPVNDIAQFNTTTAVSPSINMTGILDENSDAAPNQGLALSGAYAPDSPVDGRGLITVDVSNSVIGGLTLQYYLVDASTAVFIEMDTDQVSLGTFGLQSSSASPAATRAHMSIVHPVARPHGALRKK